MTALLWLRNLLGRKTSKTRNLSRLSPRKKEVRKPFALEVLEDRTLLNATVTLQLSPGGQSTPVTLALTSFHFGASNPASIHSIGLPSFDTLDVTTPYNASAPQLLSACTTGKHYASATLTESDAKGNAVAVWVLGDVFISSDQVSGGKNGLPSQDIQLSFHKITEVTNGGSASWNLETETKDGPAGPDPSTLSPLAAAPSSNVTLQLSDGSGTPLTLNLSSFQFGASSNTTLNLGTGLGRTIGLPSFDTLDVTTPYNASSPQLLAALASGKLYASATLTETDGSGNPVAVWVLADVFDSSDHLSGANNDALLTEDIQFTFNKITVVTHGGSASWDLETATKDGPAGPDPSTLTPIAAAPSSNLTLQLSDGSGAPLILNLSSFQFGASSNTTLNLGTGTGARSAPPSFDALDVTTALSNASPILLAALTSGHFYATATLTETDGSGNPVAVWVLADVFISSDHLGGANNSGLPSEDIQLGFGKITEVTNGGGASWNAETETSNGPAGPDPSTLTPLPAAPSSNVTLQLSDGSSAPLTLNLNSFQFGASSNTTLNLGAGTGMTIGLPSFTALDVTTALSNASPILLAALTSGKLYASATLTETDASGNPVAVWVLGDVFVSGDHLGGGNGGVPSEAIQFSFHKITEVTHGGVASWNLETETKDGPAGPNPATLTLLAAAPSSNVTLQLSDGSGTPLTFNLSSFQFGASSNTTLNLGTGTGARSAPPSFDTLDVTTVLSNASPSLLAALTNGHLYATATLTETDASGNPVAVWVLGDVLVSSDYLNGGNGGLPNEAIQFSFGQITEVTHGGLASWNLETETKDGPAGPDPSTLTPTAAAPSSTLTLQLSDDSSTPLIFNLNSFQFGASNATTLNFGTGTGGANIVPPSFTALDVATALSDVSPILLAALTTGKVYATATLTETDANGNPVAVWVLGDVLVSGDHLSGGNSGLPNESIQLNFGKITEVTNGGSASWDLETATATGPAGPDPSTLAPLAAYSPTVNVTAGSFTYDGTSHLPSATAMGVDGNPVSGNFTFTYYTGMSVNGTGTATAPAQVGTYTVVAHFNSTDPDYANADSAPVTFSIGQAPLTVNVGSDTQTYGSPANLSADLPSTVATGVNGESLDISYTSSGDNATANVGSYGINATLSNGTGLLSNYNVTLNPGTLTVNPKGLTVTANNISKTYGQTVTFAGTEFTPSGLINNDKVSSVTLSSAGAAASAGVAGSPYAIFVSAATGTGLNNYTISYVNGWLTVNKAPLIITATNQTKITGEANPAFTVSYSGFVLGETASVLGGSLVFSTPATIGSPPGIYAITPSGLTSSNYAITFVSGTLTVLSYSQATSNLAAQVNASSLPNGIQNSLQAKLQAAISSFNRGTMNAGVNQLQAFINQVNAQRGKSIDPTLADFLIAAAERIIRDVG